MGHMDDDSALFGMPTEVANRSTINNQIESRLVPIDIHVDRNQSTESEDSHVEPSNKTSIKRKKVQRGGIHTKKTSNKTNSNQSDFDKIELISSENVEVIPKQFRARGSKGKFIRNTQANDTNVN